jgi:hypothetical protein
MPKYLDFDATKDFRDNLLKRTLDPVYGKSPSPKTFTSNSYSVQSLGDSPNLLLPNVDDNRSNDLLVPQKSNVFKPNEYFIKDSFQDIPRRANLNLYPYFVQTNENIIGIMSTKTYDTESELFKFAANNIRTNPQGPVLARISQNLNTAINAKNKIGEALAGNTTTLINIIRGKQPLIEGNESITVSSSLLGKGFDFLQTVAGTQLPFSTIPGDYLTNPRNPINIRPTDVSTGTKVWQDLTGVLGSIVGIQRRPLPSRKPSDILIENMGSSSKNRLFDLLSFSKYAPNYTTSARSQMSTGVGRIPSQIAQGVKSLLGMEAPNSGAYIGDDRENDVKNATTDLFSGRPVRSSYYLSFMFDPISATLFHNTKSIMENGPIGGNLTWLSNNKTQKNVNTDKINESLSTKYPFRQGSILNITQEILDSKPQNGGDALSHIGHVLDQTSKYFKDGDTLISRGSGVRYLDNSGKDIGVQYARVWTKDRPFLTYGDTMPLYKETTKKPYYSGGTTPYRRTGIRKFDSSVMTNTWNLNIAPMSDGTTNPDFPGSSNIVRNPKGNGFYAKKYMLSIENLAWAASTLPGYTVNDLPYSERGPNGGRVMWFPPYDLKVSEQNNAKWEPNTFLGRPEPIYTYQNSERNGTISFKVIVDHPSILNLLVREHFKSVNDEDVDKFINSFFAGAKDIDFYSLIRQYSNLNQDDITMIKNYLNNGGDPNDIKRRRTATGYVVEDNPDGTSTADANKDVVDKNLTLYFNNVFPPKGDSEFKSGMTYETIKNYITNNSSKIITELTEGLTHIITSDEKNDKNDRKVIFGSEEKIDSIQSGSTITNKVNEVQGIITKTNETYTELENTLTQLKTDLLQKNISSNVVIIINSYTSEVGDDNENYLLSMRRSHSLYLMFINKLNEKGIDLKNKWNFNSLENQIGASGTQAYPIDVEHYLSELGYSGDKKIIFHTINNGSNYNLNNNFCNNAKFENPKLKLFSPVSYACRTSEFRIQYDKIKKVEKSANASTNPLSPTGNIPSSNTKPPIDLMKRIIMKTLSEEYYFKKLEETSPMIYTSLKEKFKYFHPAFHSMTPEGLNSRLTFLQQCLRPGNTIPVKGISDNSDINARNTTFGPPPVCVLRVGDFYNSKVIIKDLNIQFEQNLWDMNPEGIGIQPMIADVTMQLSFLGGHGLEKPVERLQNALSSNFFANTEMYDERSETTNTTIGGVDTKKFTKEFIESLNDIIVPPTGLKDSDGKGITQGQHIGLFVSSTVNGGPEVKSINYKYLVNDLFKQTESYFSSYPDMYNNLLTTYGSILTNLLINKDYRVIKTYNGGTMGNIEFFGLYKSSKDLSYMVNFTNSSILKYLNEKYVADKYYILDMLKITEKIPAESAEYYASTIHNYIIDNLIGKLNTMLEISSIKKFTTNRDNLIKILDKVKFILDNGYDVKIDNGKTYKSTFTTPIDFYSSVKNCIDYITDNTTKMYSKLDTSINFDNQTYNDKSIQDIIYTLYYDDRSKIIGTLGVGLQTPDEYQILDGVNTKLIEVFYKTKEVKIKFQKSPKPKNDNDITYIINNEILDTTTDEIKEIFSGNIKIENKLT